MTNIELEIIPHFDSRLDCLQNTLYSLLTKYVSSPQLILFGTWNFKFQESEITGSRIGNCLLSTKANTIVNCEEFFNVKFKLLPVDTKRIEPIVECLKCGEFALIEIAADKITWSLNQEIYMPEHYCLIRGIDIVNKILYVMDTNGVKKEECIIPFSNIPIINKMWRIDITALHDCIFTTKETVGMILKKIKSDLTLEQERNFLDYLKHHTINMNEEVKGYETNVGFCPFMWDLYNIGTGRYQTSVLIHLLMQFDNSQSLEKLYICLTELSKLWEDVRNIFIKYYKKPREIVYQRIILHMEEILKKEEQAFNLMQAYGDES